MNGIHDLGGMDGLGPVVREENEPVFHADWEQRIFSLNVAVMGRRAFNLDEFRHAIERLDPVRYLTAAYYERWVDAVTDLLVQKGQLTRTEIDARAAELASAGAAASIGRRDDPEGTEQLMGRLFGLPRVRSETTAIQPHFQVGDRVIVRTMHPKGHTRAPRYIRGKRGTIDRDQGVHTFPDTHAHGAGRAPQPLYSVRFEAREVWGGDYPADDAVYLDLWERYLEPAPGQ